jgi:sugar/nucleoside kinase (ribokinase family)/nucleoside 2-deoxyribosyltransferase
MPPDLIVVGDAAVDILEDLEPPVRRPGGAFYSALAGAALGLRTGILGQVAESGENEFIAQVQQLGINMDGLQPDPKRCVEYRIRNIDEVFPQVLISKVPHKQFQASFPQEWESTRSVLLYPSTDTALLLDIATRVKKTGGLVCLDLQHDQTDISILKKLFEITDVLFASRNELLELTDAQTDSAALEHVMIGRNTTVVIKYGMGGSTIYRRDGIPIRIPAFLANFKSTIGAGDVYNATFISRLLANESEEAAATRAALAAAVFSENVAFPAYFQALKNLDFIKELDRRTRVIAHPEQLSAVGIYLAGSFLSAPMRNWVDLICNVLESKGFRLFSPYREVGMLNSRSSSEDKAKTFELDIKGIDSAKMVVALLDGIGRGGTSWELGYAYSTGKPIFGLLTDPEFSVSNMVYQSCKSINSTPKGMLNDIYAYLVAYDIL